MLLMGACELYEITKDFPLQFSETSNQFANILEANGRKQHVNKSTYHRGNHTLDLVITRRWSCLIRESPKVLDPSLCDNKGNVANSVAITHFNNF